jgi:3-dehydroquinate synthase
MKKLSVKTSAKTYDVMMERGILSRAGELIRPSGQVYLISDDGVPEQWQKVLQEQFPKAPFYRFPHGEQSKNLTTWQGILQDMLAHDLSRKDMVIALGGGVTGDMAGFAAACYMRGIAYVNIPTTSLSQIDSSIGGKTAVDLAGAKNCVGAFWQPSLVLVDPDVLTTLSTRQFHNGLLEAVKEGLTFDPELFAIFEQDDYADHVEDIIWKCLNIKKNIVEQDERESGLRKLLNFGHTYGHAYETYYGLDRYLHGECVGMGMMTIMKNQAIKDRLRKVLARMNEPVSCDADHDRIARLIMHDKKADHDHVTIVQVDEIGHGHLEDWSMEEIRGKLEDE